MDRYYGFDLGDAESAVSCLNKSDVTVPRIIPVREVGSVVTAYARRRDGALVQEEAPMERRSTPPVFFETINGKRQEVVIRFSSAPRMVRMAVLAVVVLFLPVICALLINGFDFGSLNLGGSAVWFCIFVPVVPIYLLKFGRIDMYDRPWFYLVEGSGTSKRLKRVKAKEKHSFKYYLEMIPHGIGAILGILFALACFVTMVYLTAGYDV